MKEGINIKNRILKVISALLLVCFLISSSAGSITASASSLEDKKEQLEQQLEDTDKKLQSLKSQKSSKSEYLKTLNKKLDIVSEKNDSLEEQIETTKSDISNLNASIDANNKEVQELEKSVNNSETEIKKLEDEIDKGYYEYTQRLKTMYVSGETKLSLVEVILESNSLADALTRIQMIKSISEHDNELLSGLMDKKETLDGKIQKLLKEREKITSILTNLRQQKENLVVKQENLVNTRKELKSTEQEYLTLEKETNAQIKELSSSEQMYGEYRTNTEKELQEIDNAIEAADKQYQDAKPPADDNVSEGSQSSKPSSSKYLNLTYPCPAYTTITCAYGAYSGHTGCDFSTHGNENQKIVAAESGTVILVKNLNYSYGHYIVIRHDKKTSSGKTAYTLYAHNNKIIVSEGQYVKRGQQIAYSGSTGNSTGPHCHFELRIGGSSQRYAVNPASYF